MTEIQNKKSLEKKPGGPPIIAPADSTNLLFEFLFQFDRFWKKNIILKMNMKM